MKKEKGKEIIGYRIGQRLFCPSCYEKEASPLKAVQDPESSEVKFPSKPITAEDVNIFICERCKGIKGPSAGEVKIQEQKNLTDLQDMIEDSASKIAFLGDFFSRGRSGDASYFSEDGESGFYHILVDLQQDLEFVVDELSEMRQKDLIIEKQETS